MTKTKSFKDNYKDLLSVPTSTTNEISPDSVVITPTVNLPIEKNVEVEEVILPPAQPIRVELTEEIADVLTEQREQSAKVLESVMKTNTKIANNISKYFKASTETNKKLVEAITSLTDKIELLEAKLEAIENLEIPTPIVNVQMPKTKVHKEIHRDKKTGQISHITETEIVDDEDE